VQAVVIDQIVRDAADHFDAFVLEHRAVDPACRLAQVGSVLAPLPSATA